MIGSVFIKCNAANPDVPLRPLCAFKGSPSSLRVIDVPRKIGAWQITAVRVTATYPDNRAVAKDAVLTGGAWVATLDAPDAVGDVAGGLVVTADGVDEDGAEVKGYVLGIGDLRVLDRDLSITVGGEVYFLHFFDEIPEEPHKGDMCVIGGALKWWDGEGWELFGAGGDMSHSEFEGLPAEDLDADEVGFPEICEVINKMKNALRPAAIVAALCLAAFGASAAPSVEKSKLSALKGGSNVVTSVTFDGLATDAALSSASNALAEAISSATPGDYAAVSNKAYAAATQDALDAEATARQAGDAAITNALSSYALKDDLTSLAPLASLEAHIADTNNPHAVTAAQIGALTAETDPLFAAWTNGTSIAAGSGAIASGNYASALGCNNNASGNYASALGYNNLAKGNGSSAIGCDNKVGGNGSSAIGYNNMANGYYASALGYNNNASGNCSSALGYNNLAKGNGSSAIGYQAYASVAYSLAVSQTPSLIYLGSSRTDGGATARTLQSYLDERATTNDVAALAAKIPVISATDPTFSNAVNVAAKALIEEKLAALDPAESTIRETIAALQSIYETETATEE